ncbi:MAG: SPASM domain-containing protein [Cytophagaceae bacterium]|nr:SPASM domain-containing protein [Cytophagaceae bacterium]MDW8455923.1 radical SAM/SPASM domain-containing protein [Cytophagaceae bacterium]
MNRKLSDGLNLLSKATPKRLANAMMVFYSYYYSLYQKQAYHKGLPISISIEPTTSCNLRCPECPSGLRSFTRPTGMLDEKLYKKIIDELHPTLWYLTFYFQGEPFLNPGFLDMVRYASEKKIYTATSTNAHYLNNENARKTVESGLDRLIISIDGTTQDTYEQYRVGGQLQRVIEGTENVLHWRQKLKSKTPYIIFQFLVLKPNEHQVPDVYKLAKKLKVDKVVLKTAQIYNYENDSHLIPVNEKYARYKKGNDGKYIIKNKLLNHCWKMWHSCVITWDGRVLPCCFDKDALHSMGNINNEKFASVWNNHHYNAFRNRILISRKQIDICTNCTEGLSVWV